MAKTKRKRRQRGTGTVIQLGPDRWRGAISLGYLPNGKRDRRYVYATTEDGAWQSLEQLIKEHNAGRLPEEPASLTVAEFLRHWLEDVKRPDLAPTTFEEYETVIRIHIAPHIGHRKLSNLKPLQVQRLYSHLAAAGVSAYRRAKAHMILRQALDQAVRWRYLSDNPCAAVEAPTEPRPEVKPLTENEVLKILDAARGDRYEALWVLALTTGMRLGEMLGLSWQDVALESRILLVRQKLQEVRGRPQLARGGKTAAAVRRVDLPELTAVALAAHRERMAAEGRDTERGLVFVATNGAPCRRSHLRNRHWVPILKRAGVDYRKQHAMRHTVATLLLEDGSPVHDVQGLLGHARASITTDIYGHYRPGRGRETARRIEAILGAGGTSATH